MIHNVYSIRDQKTQSFDAPVQFQNDDVALRFFISCVEKVPLMSENPADFDMYQIGTFCSETATLAPLECVQLKYNGLNCIKSPTKGNNADETTKVGDDPSV